MPALIKNNNFLYVNLNNLLESFNIQKNKMHKINNSGIKIENGFWSASTNLTNEKCNAHNEERMNSKHIFKNWLLNFNTQCNCLKFIF